MDFQALYYIGGVLVVGITLFNFIMAIGQRRGATDAQVKSYTDDRASWSIKFDALHNLAMLNDQRTNQRISDLQLETSTRFEKVMDRLNATLLTMAKEHPTKNDLTAMKEEILARIDGSHYNASFKRRDGN